MFTRGKPWPILVAFCAWLVVQPLLQELLQVAGVPVWLRWLLFAVGLMLLVAWYFLWLYNTASPLRSRLQRGRREHPDALTELVMLDPEWNPVENPTIALLVVDRSFLAFEDGLMRIEAADVASVSVTHVTPRRQAIVLALPDSTWTAVPVAASLGGAASGRVVHETADRIGAALRAPRA